MAAAQPRTVDVAVVGAGIVGSATAAYLAEAGLRVLLVDAVGVAAAASGRNSGVVQHPLDPVLAALYRDSLPLLRTLAASGAEAFRLAAEPAGLLYVGESEAAAGELWAALAASHPELEPVCLLGADLVAVEPTVAPGLAAVRLSIGFPVGPAAVTRAFAARASALGAEVVVGEPARVELDAGRAVGVRMAGQLRPAGHVVVAAGPWSPGLVDPSGAWQPIRRLWGAVAEVSLPTPPRHVLEELEIDQTIEPGGRARTDDPADDNAVGISFSIVTADGRSTIGSTFTEREPDDGSLAPALVARATRFVPSVARAGFVGTRRCARPLSLDGRPLIGAVPGADRLTIAAGHGPWGISTGAASARLVADLVLGGTASIPPELDPARFGRPGAGAYLATAEIR